MLERCDYEGPGTYMFRNKRTGRVYIGGSVHVKKRLYQHVVQLNRGLGSPLMQDDWNANPEDFEFRVVERTTDRTGAYRAEIKWIRKLQKAGHALYNVRLHAHWSIRSDEPKAAIGGTVPKRLKDAVVLAVEKESMYEHVTLTSWLQRAIENELQRIEEEEQQRLPLLTAS